MYLVCPVWAEVLSTRAPVDVLELILELPPAAAVKLQDALDGPVTEPLG